MKRTGRNRAKKNDEDEDLVDEDEAEAGAEEPGSLTAPTLPLGEPSMDASAAFRELEQRSFHDPLTAPTIPLDDVTPPIPVTSSNVQLCSKVLSKLRAITLQIRKAGKKKMELKEIQKGLSPLNLNTRVLTI